MGYTLEFYALDRKRLDRAIGRGDPRVVETVRRRQGRLLDPGVGARRLPWEDALEALVTGTRGRDLLARGVEAGGPPETADEAEALALMALIRALGRRLGDMIHTTRGGAKFRGLLEPGLAQRLGAGVDWRLLLERPLYGLVSPEYPSWGGLRRQELDQVFGPGMAARLTRVKDDDYRRWLQDLHAQVEEARRAQTDLVTLYL